MAPFCGVQVSLLLLLSSRLSHSSHLCILSPQRSLEIPGVFPAIWYIHQNTALCADTSLLTLKTQPVLQISPDVCFYYCSGFFRVFWSRLLSLRTVWISLRRKLTGDDANSPAHGWEPDLSWTVLSSLNFSLAHWVCIAIFCVSVQYVRVQRRKLKSPPPAYSPSFSGQLKSFKKYKFSILAWHHMISVWLYQWSFM